jgi:nucleotide-binding universal stress UspA family protein
MTIEPTAIRSILVPLDGSPFSEQAIELARKIASAGNAKIRLALVHEPPLVPFAVPPSKHAISAELNHRKAERTYLREVQGRLRARGTPVAAAATLMGVPGPALAEYATEMKVDMVVMATHGRGGLQRAWLGSVADYLVRNLEIPVLLVRPHAISGPVTESSATRILVPLDGSPLSEQALAPALSMALLWNLELALLQVVQPVPNSIEPMLPIPTGYDEELTHSWRNQVQEYLDGLAGQLRQQGVRASASAVIGWHSIESILNEAQAEGTAMVVVATHGRGGLSRLTIGSVADKLVRGAEVPVLVYRPKKQAGAKRLLKAG